HKVAAPCGSRGEDARCSTSVLSRSRSQADRALPAAQSCYNVRIEGRKRTLQHICAVAEPVTGRSGAPSGTKLLQRAGRGVKTHVAAHLCCRGALSRPIGSSQRRKVQTSGHKALCG